MKIAFTGAHRVGKTTLAEKLQASLPDYLFIPEPYVELEELGHSFSETPKSEDFIAQLEYAIERICIDEPHVIFDRSPLDLFVYLYLTSDTKTSQSFYLKVREAMTEIDLLVFVPIETPDLIGCPKDEFPELREQVNELLHEWIGDFDLDTIEVRGTVSEREEQILHKISEM